MVGHAVIVEEIGTAAIRSHQNVENAFVEQIGVGGGAANFGCSKADSQRLGSFDELSSTEIAENMRGLCIAHALLNFFDLIFNMAIGDENVGPAVIVVIEEEATEAERDQRRAPDFGAGSFIDK